MVLLVDQTTSVVITIITLTVPLLIHLIKALWEKRQGKKKDPKLQGNDVTDPETYLKRGKKLLLIAAGLFVFDFLLGRLLIRMDLTVWFEVLYILGLLMGIAIFVCFLLGIIYYIKGKKKS